MLMRRVLQPWLLSYIGKLDAGGALGGDHAGYAPSQQSGLGAIGSPHGKERSHSRLVGATCRCAARMLLRYGLYVGVWPQ